jgi:hypothetical protein
MKSSFIPREQVPQIGHTMKRNHIITAAVEYQARCERAARESEAAALFAPFGMAEAPKVECADWWALAGYNGGFGDLANKACGEWPVKFCAKKLTELRRAFAALESQESVT